MHLNPKLIQALLVLKGVDVRTAAKLIHLPYGTLQGWLNESISDDESLFPFETQLELMTLLGIQDSSMRSDVVHYWTLHETLFSRESEVYAPLQVVLTAFGPAQVAYVAQDSDPMITLRAKAHFALKFPGFLAMLEVSAHPLRKISMNPGEMPMLSWTEGTQGVLLSEDEYGQLEPGSLRVAGLSKCLTYSSEMNKWEMLRESAMQGGFSPEQVAALLLGPTAPALPPTPASVTSKTTQPRVKPSAAPAPAPSAAAPAPQSEAELFSKPVEGA